MFTHYLMHDTKKHDIWLLRLYIYLQHHLQEYRWKEIGNLNPSSSEPWIIGT